MADGWPPMGCDGEGSAEAITPWHPRREGGINTLDRRGRREVVVWRELERRGGWGRLARPIISEGEEEVLSNGVICLVLKSWGCIMSCS